MLFNSMEFILFFPIAFLGYWMLPQKIRYIWLLICSYYFYMCWNPVYVLLLLFATITTYICGLILEKQKKDGVLKKRRILYKKIYLGITLILNLGILLYFKYVNFFIYYLLAICDRLDISINIQEIEIVLPVGISFYIFQVIGYSIDVYRNEIYAERNFLKYALFVSFFPQLVAGPIERSKNLLMQLKRRQKFSWDNLKKGIMLMLYGFFLKVVIADRAAIIVNTVYEEYERYPGLYIAIATFFFAIQIYCDFYGYSTIAKGTALTMGIKLMDNFNAPYYSKSVKEFWRRWHMSLSYWFRDYLYIPLGGNRKGMVRKEGNLLITFAISGLWHGASMHYVIWGFLNGFYQVIADIYVGIKKFLYRKFNMQIMESSVFSKRIFKQLVTFMLICITWVFFRADGLNHSLMLLKSVFMEFNWWIFFDDSLFQLGVNERYFTVLLAAIGVLFVIDYFKYKDKDILEIFFKQGMVFKLLSGMILVLTIVLFGCYGEMYEASEFIYFQF